MRKILILAAATLGLAACQSGGASNTGLIVAANSYDAIEVTATAYIGYCLGHRTAGGCNATAVSRLISAVRAARIARNNAEAWIAANPNGTPPSAIVTALTTALSTLQGIEIAYNIGSK